MTEAAQATETVQTNTETVPAGDATDDTTQAGAFSDTGGEQGGTVETPPAEEGGTDGESAFSDDAGGGESAEGEAAFSDGDAASDEAPTGAPEKYEEFTMPEGMSVNEGALEAFQPMAKEMGLDQENAQKMLDLGVKLVEENMVMQEKAYVDQVNTWAKEMAEDPDIGGSAENLSKSQKLADRALMRLKIPGLAQFLKESGLHRQPLLVKAFRKFAETTGEDSFEQGTGPGGGKTFSQIHYPKSQHVE